MEYFSHLQKEEECDVESVASDDSEEVRNDIETRLYSVIHHNDLTQPLPPELEALYSIEHTDKGEVIVSLKENSPVNGLNKILDSSVDQIVPSQDENEQYIKTAPTVNVENCSAGKEGKFYFRPKAKHLRYSDVLIDENELEELPILVNGCANEKEINWKNNLKFDFIPVGDDNIDHKIAKSRLKLQKKLAVLFSKISHTNPHICDVKLRSLLSEISKTHTNKNRLRVGDIVKKNRRFFLNPINFKNRLKDIKRNHNSLEFPRNFISDSCDGIIRSQIERLLLKNPRYTLKNIKKKLHRSGYMFPISMIKNILSQFPNNNIDQFKNPFSVKLPTNDEPLIINIIESSNTNAETSSIPVITINSSDEESNNATDNRKLILNNNTKIVETEQSNLTQDYNETSTTKTSFRMPPSCPPKKWTKKMIKFYDKESKRLNTFDIKKIMSDLGKDSNPSDWRCSNDDYTKQCKRKDDTKNMRCINCWRFGHSAFSCRQPKQSATCHMCGVEGHRWYSCPQKKCLNCGDPNNSFCSMCRRCVDYSSLGCSCQICGSQNHPKELCTDLWRCYHSTTNNGAIVNTIQTSNNRKCCSYCSEKGHFAYECQMDSFGQNSNSEFVLNFHPLQQLCDYRDILLSDDLYGKLQTSEGDKFLQFLSNNCKSRIDILATDDKQRNVLRCFGSPEQWDQVRSEVMKFNQSNNVSKKKIKTKKRYKRKNSLPMSPTFDEYDPYKYSFRPEKRKKRKM